MTPLARIAELERALAGSIYVLDSEARKLEVAYGVGPVSARLLVALYRAHGVLRACEIDRLTESERPVANRIDPEFRQVRTIHQTIWQIRKKVGPGFILARNGVGYWLSDEGRAAVKKALDAS